MFTARAENRLTLRQDNVFYRLADISHNLGLIKDELYTAIKDEKSIVDTSLAQLKKGANNDDLLMLLGRDQANISKLHTLTDNQLNERSIQALWAEYRYEPYLKREQREIERIKRYRDVAINDYTIFKNLPGLSKELQEKIERYKPTTIADASLFLV